MGDHTQVTGDIRIKYPSKTGEIAIVGICAFALTSVSTIAIVLTYQSSNPEIKPQNLFEGVFAVLLAVAASTVVVIVLARVFRISGFRAVLAILVPACLLMSLAPAARCLDIPIPVLLRFVFSGLKADAKELENQFGMKFVYISPGIFMMGRTKICTR